jgi:large subunit ribosomal protein L25
MAEITLKAVSGRTTGTGPSKRIRAEGQVPAVVYGLGSDPVSVTVDWRPLREVLTTDAGLNVLIDLDVDGDVSLCMVKELQRHPIKGNVLHLDFLRVSRDAEITVDVPIVLEGEAIEVERADGTVDHLLFALSISAKPADIPNELTIDISGLEMGDHIRVGDLPLPAGVTTDVDPEELVVTTVHSTVAADVEAADVEAAEAAEAEAAEGEGAEGEGEGGESAEPAAEGASEGDAEG